jgi:FSR family fosmidomycin resistance protein-like MFS transporter
MTAESLAHSRYIIAAGTLALLWTVGRGYDRSGSAVAPAAAAPRRHPTLSSRRVRAALTILVALVFSKFVYLTSLTSFYTFYLIHRFGVPVQTAQLRLFVFLGAVAAHIDALDHKHRVSR